MGHFPRQAAVYFVQAGFKGGGLYQSALLFNDLGGEGAQWSRRQQPPLPWYRSPIVEARKRVPDHGAHVRNARLAEFALERLADRLRQPRPAANVESVSIRKTRQCGPAKFERQRHVVSGRN